MAPPRFVLKSGYVVVEDGEIRRDDYGHTLHVAPAYDESHVPDIQAWFEEHYTIRFRNYPVDEHYLGDLHEVVPTGTE